MDPDAWGWLRKQSTEDLQRLKVLATRLSFATCEPSSEDVSFLQRLSGAYGLALPDWMKTDEEVNRDE